jgi:4-hydroxybenzoate polyprenyltransferase
MTEAEAAGRARPTTSRARRLLKRSRPRFWLYLAGPVLVGLAYGADGPAELVTPMTVALFLYFLVPANAYLYGVNDVFDADADAENPKKEGREVRYRGEPLAVAATAVSGAAGLALLFVVPTPAVPWFAGFLLLATAYSVPPFRLKTTPLLDSLSNGLYVLPGAGAYVVVAGTAPPTAALVGAWLWTMAMHTFSAIPDVEPDRRAGIRTTATVLGERGALAYCAVVWLLAAAAFAALSPRAGALIAIYPAFVGVVAAGVAVDRAYWWFPAINTVVGMVLTLAGLWGTVHG